MTSRSSRDSSERDAPINPPARFPYLIGRNVRAYRRGTRVNPSPLVYGPGCCKCRKSTRPRRLWIRSDFWGAVMGWTVLNLGSSYSMWQLLWICLPIAYINENRMILRFSHLRRSATTFNYYSPPELLPKPLRLKVRYRFRNLFCNSEKKTILWPGVIL